MTSNENTAWGDESIRVRAEKPLYLLGACILDDSALEAIREIERLVPKRAKKVHWREMNQRAQRQALGIIADIQHITYIVAASPIHPHGQERARRKCLERLLITLEENSVENLILESRDAFLDKKDIDFLFYLRRSGIASRIDLHHKQGNDDSFLCIPDQLLGAYGETIASENRKPRWSKIWNEIEKSIEVINIDV